MNTEINVTNEIINIDTTTSVIDVNVTNEIIVIEATQGAYPLPATVYSVFGRTGDVVALEGDYDLSELGDVVLTSPVTGQVLKFNGTSWVNGTDINTDLVTSVFGRIGAITAQSGDYTTSLVTEGTNLYYTDGRARASLSAGTGISYSTTTGVISSTITQYTDALARNAISLTTSGTSGAATYSPLTGVLNVPQYIGGVTSVFGRTGAIVAASGDYSTNQVTENTNLYFTDARAREALSLTTTGTSGVATYNSTTGAFNIPNYSTDLSGYVPYTGATANVDLGTFNLTADVITGATGSFASNGGSGTFAINHSSGSGIALNITKGGNGEGLYINKTSGSGNAATIIGTLNATTLVKSGGTSSQYLMADGSVSTLTNPITGTGTTNTLPKFTGTSAIGNSNITDTGSLITLGSNTYVNGALGIGTSSLNGRNLLIDRTLTGTTVSISVFNISTIASDVTNTASSFRSSPSTQAAAFTLGALNHFQATNVTIGSGNSVTTQVGYVAGTLSSATNNYGFQGQLAAATNTWNLYMSGTANNYLAGSLGIGTTSLTGYSLRLANNITGSTTSFAIRNTGIVQSDVTSSAFGVSNTAQTAAASFTLGSYYHFAAGQSAFGAGSTVTNQYGYYIDSTLIGATNNYGFYGNIAAATNRWNLYMVGTASNYMAGNLLLATTTDSGYKLNVNGTSYFSGVATFASSVTASSFIKSGGTSAEILAADGSVITAGTNITISGGTISASGGGGGSMAIGGSITGATTGSVLFVNSGATLAQDNANFFWDDTNNRLGIGTTTIGSTLQINGGAAIGYSDSTAAPTNGLVVKGFITGGGNYPSRVVNLDMSNQPGFPNAAFLFPNNGKFSIIELSVFGTNDIFFQGLPGTSAGYTYLEDYNGAGLILGTGTSGTAKPIRFAISRVEKMRLDGSGNLAIGTATIGSKLQVNGNAAIGYSASTAAPTNGLQVAGDILVAGTGSTTTTPRIVGVNGYTVNNAARFQFGDNANCFQNVYGGYMQIISYHAMEIYGGRVGTATAFNTSVANTNPSLSVIGTEITRPVLVVKAATSQSANIQEWRNSSNTVLASMSNAGSITSASFKTTSGTAAQILAANGSVITAGTNITISGGTISATGGGASITLDAIGSTPNANAATLTGSALNLEPASASFGGVVTTGVQTFGGAKTFDSSITALSIVKSGGTSAQYLMADGSVTTGTGGTVSVTIGQAVVSGTENSILFVGAGNLLAQDNANFSWNDTTNKLNIGGDALVTGVLSQTIVTNRQTASYTLALTDRSKLVEMNVATANNLTVPLNSSVAYPIGTEINIVQYGAGQTTVVATGGVTIRSTNNWVKLNARYGAVTLIKIGTDEWYLFGNLNA